MKKKSSIEEKTNEKLIERKISVGVMCVWEWKRDLKLHKNQCEKQETLLWHEENVTELYTCGLKAINSSAVVRKPFRGRLKEKSHTIARILL